MRPRERLPSAMSSPAAAVVTCRDEMRELMRSAVDEEEAPWRARKQVHEAAAAMKGGEVAGGAGSRAGARREDGAEASPRRRSAVAERRRAARERHDEKMTKRMTKAP